MHALRLVYSTGINKMNTSNKHLPNKHSMGYSVYP